MPQGWDLGVLGGVKNFSLGICDGAPWTAHSSFLLFFRHLNGCVLESKYFSRPHLMITDAFNAGYNQARRRLRDEQLMSEYYTIELRHVISNYVAF